MVELSRQETWRDGTAHRSPLAGSNIKPLPQSAFPFLLFLPPSHFNHFDTPTIASPGCLLLHSTVNEFIYCDTCNLPSQDDVMAACAKKGTKPGSSRTSPRRGSSSSNM